MQLNIYLPDQYETNMKNTTYTINVTPMQSHIRDIYDQQVFTGYNKAVVALKSICHDLNIDCDDFDYDNPNVQNFGGIGYDYRVIFSVNN